VTRLAHEMGVEVCAGTDAIIDSEDAPLPALHGEMATLVEDCGSPRRGPGRRNSSLGPGYRHFQTHGAIEPGRAADLVILRADPTADIGNTKAIELIIKAGRRVPEAGR